MRSEPEAGPAHVAVVSFLASRVVPSGGFWVALAGGVALARVAERRGARRSCGTSIAAMLETVAIIGPLRFGVPLTQAVTAPLLGRLEARGMPAWLQMLICGVLRLAQNTLQTAVFIWILAGGLDAFTGTYDAIAGRLGFSVGNTETLVFTAIGLVAWATFASIVQVLVYRRGLLRWDAVAAEEALLHGAVEPALRPTDDSPPVLSDAPADRSASAGASSALRSRGELAARFDPRLLALIAVALFAVLLASTEWVVLAGVAAFLAIAWVVSRPDPTPLQAGLAFTALLGFSVFMLALIGGLGLEVALRRAIRAGLLVMTATWLRAAARAEGLRFVFRRALRRLRRIPSIPEASQVLDSLSSEARLATSGRAFAASLEDVPHRPLPFVDAVLGWVVREARAPHPPS
ncbi:MAG TPA: hypothetical protein VI111_02320 [Thermoleophilaceae bacterium]